MKDVLCGSEIQRFYSKQSVLNISYGLSDNNLLFILQQNVLSLLYFLPSTFSKTSDRLMPVAFVFVPLFYVYIGITSCVYKISQKNNFFKM